MKRNKIVFAFCAAALTLSAAAAGEIPSTKGVL